MGELESKEPQLLIQAEKEPIEESRNKKFKAMDKRDESKRICSLGLFCCTKRNSMSSLQKKLLDEESLVESEPETYSRKPGWKAMPYILGNDTIERMASFGMQANFTLYLMRVYNMDQVEAANVLNTWVAVSNIVPLIGAFVADAYLGKFLTIAVGSFGSLAGMVVMTLTASVPQLHPAPCPFQMQQQGVCTGHTNLHLGVLFLGLFWAAIGTGGIRPCSIPFAIDQFDLTTVEGRQGSASFYSMYYTTQTIILLINQTLMVYIQDSVSWTLGFGLPSLFMFVAIILFFAGTKVYAYVKPEGSIFSTIAHVLVAAKHKRHLRLPTVEDGQGGFYDPPLEKDAESKLPLTQEFRCLNKASLIVESELNDDGSSRDQWRLCSVQQVEELKCLIKIMPIWITSIILYLPIGQSSIFPISQALKMDRHLGPSFEIPSASISVIMLLTIGVFLPFYDQVLAPALAKITKQEGGLTTLQRIGLGHAFGILTMVASGLVERRRRALAIALGGASDGVATMSVMWLAPQFVFLAFCQAFSVVGYTEFFNKESPDNMRSVGNALICLQASIASYLSSFLVNIVHDYSGKQGQPDWLDSDINKGRLDYFYYLTAVLGVLNFSFFLFCARRYCYKTFLKQ